MTKFLPSITMKEFIDCLEIAENAIVDVPDRFERQKAKKYANKLKEEISSKIKYIEDIYCSKIIFNQGKYCDQPIRYQIGKIKEIKNKTYIIDLGITVKKSDVICFIRNPTAKIKPVQV